jgi:hypothetical protein
MIEPPPARRIAGTAYLTDRNTPSRFTAVCRRQSANVISIALHKMPIPALATITSKPPLGGFDYCRPAILHTYVLMKIDRFAAGAANLLRHCLASGIVQVDYHDFGAFSREARRTSGANARRPAGYDSDLAVHLSHSALQSAERR